MEVIGELLEPLTTQLYAWRIQVAIGTLLTAILVGVLAWRFGWVDAARRHPGRAGLLAAIVLAFAVPTAWYMASPLIIRTSLVEAAPTAIPRATPVAPSATPLPSAVASSNVTATPTPTAAPTPFEPVTVASGPFVGTDEFHFGNGEATIVELEPGRYHLRFTGFSVRNGPDLFVVLSPDPDGYTDDSLEVGRLKATDGSFGYDLPEGVDPTRFQSALIWCKQFAHLFAVATFEA